VTPGEIAAHIARRLPDGESADPPEPVTGGLLNQAWRIRLGNRSLFVKHAPPYIAAAPEVPLAPERIGFEARALFALAPGGPLARVPTDLVRPPLPVDYDPSAAVLVMEDLGALPDLGCDWRAGRLDGLELAGHLGGFVGRLHTATLHDEGAAESFRNEPIQRTRHQVQYRRAESSLESAGVADAAALGALAEDLGERLQQPGRCLVMGDLWPPSVLRDRRRLRLIDWEFCHFGVPAQDLGHFAAHVWMHWHRAGRGPMRDALRSFWVRFLEGYRAAVGPASGSLLDRTTRSDAAIHCGAEILVRAVAPFREGYLYADAGHESEPVRRAVRAAADRMRTAARAPELEQLV
jgi:hypothetical protein